MIQPEPEQQTKEVVAVARVTKALRDAGMHPDSIGLGILNLYDRDPHEPDGYFATVTVAVTP